jgi:hypothetical protein
MDHAAVAIIGNTMSSQLASANKTKGPITGFRGPVEQSLEPANNPERLENNLRRSL